MVHFKKKRFGADTG
jgi:hypothetical protein